ncbi:MAG: hypothetical protein K8R54_02250 [Bacteroidales bacterium]|nr:hypothetical protein [Bacteroidales bacterium]
MRLNKTNKKFLHSTENITFEFYLLNKIMGTSARNYTTSTIKRLFNFANNQCAKPGCTNKIVAEDGKTLIGQIAHIEAASEKGPRYNPKMTDTERADFPNLILLCDEHHKIIDNKENEKKYPRKLLWEWKKEHEAKSEKDKYEVPDEIVEQIINKLEELFSEFLINYSSFDEVKDFGILENIFDYIFSNVLEEKEVYEITENEIVELKIKIPLNFGSYDKKIIEQYFIDLWNRKAIIERFIGNENQEKVKALKIDIQRSYRKLKNSKDIQTPIKDFSIIEEMSKKYIPQINISNPDYFANSIALILYFFEICDFGKKTENEKKNDSQLNLF